MKPSPDAMDKKSDTKFLKKRGNSQPPSVAKERRQAKYPHPTKITTRKKPPRHRSVEEKKESK